jgi:5-methyltetrahydrofolate--homocysteine methyltransferase
MVITAGDLHEAGIDAPMLVGGAALSDRFTRRRIAPAYQQLVCYAKDAMNGLNLMNRLMDPAERVSLTQEHSADEDEAPAAEAAGYVESTTRSSRVRLDVPPHPIPYRERIVRDVPQLREVWGFINPQMLYVKHMGFKGNFERRLAERDPKALELNAIIEEVKDEAATFMKVRAVWQFFEAEGEGNSVRVFEPGNNGSPLHEFRFPRQRREDGVCLADYVMSGKNGARDSLAVFVVGAGEGVRERSEEYKRRGEYVKSHAIQSLALETAEACAEWLHRRIREDWGFPDPPEISMIDRMKARYRTRRYSFGYAACPNLEDQEGLFRLIRPEDIGVNLTEGFMMEPEASVSAIVLPHPDCTYFDVEK